MKRCCFLLLLLISFSLTVYAEFPEIPVLKQRVTDQTATLTSVQVQRLSQKLEELETTKGSQVVVLIIPTTGDYVIEEYAIKLAHDINQLGRKKIDDGVVLLVAKNDRKLRIEVGYGLEGAIPDALAKRIVTQIITPQFRSGDFYGGIDHGVDAIIQLINGEELPIPNNEGLGEIANPLFFTIGLFAFPFLLLVAAWFKKKFGKVKGGVLAIVMNAIIGLVIITGVIGLFYTILLSIFSLASHSGKKRSGSYRGRGFSGGGWSGGGSWSGGGGFSGGGGGGGFGGGGASGGW